MACRHVFTTKLRDSRGRPTAWCQTCRAIFDERATPEDQQQARQQQAQQAQATFELHHMRPEPQIHINLQKKREGHGKQELRWLTIAEIMKGTWGGGNE